MNRPVALEVPPTLADRAARVAAVAAEHAAAVDREGRFPAETFAAAKAAGLMSLLHPVRTGGEGRSVSEVAEVCYLLGQACGSSGLIFAMHQIMTACVTRHFEGSEWHAAFLRRAAAEQWLLASSTTEGAKRDMRSSDAPLVTEAGVVRLDRDASVISYGLETDVIVTLARRAPEAAASDQVLLVISRDNYTLTPSQSWDTLGMRGTCSQGFALKAEADPAQVIPTPYSDIHIQTMTPCAHLLWSSVWAGIAASAVERARRFIRKAAAAAGEPPPAAVHLTRAQASLRALRALVAAALARFEAVDGDPKAMGTMEYQTSINLLKVDASELAVAAVMSALRACGLAGYRNDGDWTLGRHLRDVLSSPIMISNERILANLASTSLMSETPKTLKG